MLTTTTNPGPNLTRLVPFGATGCLNCQNNGTADIEKHLMTIHLQKRLKKRGTVHPSSRTFWRVSTLTFASSRIMKILQRLAIQEGTLPP